MRVLFAANEKCTAKQGRIYGGAEEAAAPQFQKHLI